MNDIEIKVRMTEKALRRGITDKRHDPIESIVTCLPTHARGRGKTLLQDKMIPRNEAGWEEYGATGTFHITDVDAAVRFIKENGGNVPWGFD